MQDRFQHGLVDAVVEELHVFRAFFEHVAEDAFQQAFGQFHVAPEVAESHLGLDHPELGEVPGRVAVSARKVGPNVYVLPSPQAKISASSCPLTVRYAGRSKKSSEKSTSPPSRCAGILPVCGVAVSAS